MIFYCRSHHEHSPSPPPLAGEEKQNRSAKLPPSLTLPLKGGENASVPAEAPRHEVHEWWHKLFTSPLEGEVGPRSGPGGG